MTLPQLKKDIKVKATIARAVPLPPISLKKVQFHYSHQTRKLKIFLINLEQLLKLVMKNCLKTFGQLQE